MARLIDTRLRFLAHPVVELSANVLVDIQVSSGVLMRLPCITFAEPLPRNLRRQAQDLLARVPHALAAARGPCLRLRPRSVLRDGQSLATAPVSAVQRRSIAQRPEGVRPRSFGTPERWAVMSAVHQSNLRLEPHTAGRVLPWPTSKMDACTGLTIESITDLRIGVPLQMHIHVMDVRDRVNLHGIKLMRGRASTLSGERGSCCVSSGSRRPAQDGAR